MVDPAVFLWIAIPAFSFLFYAVLFILRRQQLGSVARWYSAFLATAGLWSLSSMLLHANLSFIDPLWVVRFVMLGNYGLPVAMLGITLSFLADRRQQRLISIEIILYLIATVFNVAGLLVTSTRVNEGLITNQYGSGLISVMAVWLFGFCLSVFLLFRELQHARDPIYRNRIQYLLLTFVLMLTASLLNTTSLAAYPIDHLLLALTATLISLSISRYQILEILHAIRRLTVLVLFVLLYISIVTVAIYVLAGLDKPWRLPGSIGAATLTALLLLSFAPIRQGLSDLIERFFFPRQYNVHALLYAVSQVSNRLRPPREVGTDILRQLCRSFRCEYASLFIKQDNGKVYRCIASINEPDVTYPLDFQSDSPLMHELAAYGNASHIDNLRELSRLRSLWINEWQLLDTLHVQVLVPITADKEFIGFFVLSGKQDGQPFTHQELQQTLPMLANQVSIALSNSRLYTQELARADQLAQANVELQQVHGALSESVDHTRRQAARAEALVRIADRLNAQLDLDAVLRAVCEETARALNVPAITVCLYDEKDNALHFKASYGLPVTFSVRYQPIPSNVFHRFVATGTSWVITHDSVEMVGLPNAELFAEIHIHAIMSSSMIREGQVVGMLAAYVYDHERSFNDDEQALLKGIAAQAAQAIVNARLYADAQRRLHNVEALRHIDVAITSETGLKNTLQVILEQVIEQLAVDAADVLLLELTTNTLQFIVGRGFETTPERRVNLSGLIDSAGEAVLERRMVQIPNLVLTSDGTPELLMAVERFQAYYGVPLIAKGQVKGVLEVFHRAPLDPDDEWLALLNALSAQAAIAIDNSELFTNLQHTNEELRAAYESTLEGWARALELRDQETQGHTRRVAEVTVKLARKLGVNEDDIVHVRRGALLHDIGKMAIPDSILLKPGSLTDDEWKIMRQHPTFAYQMLSTISFLSPALDIPFSHHERWDGAGYPRGLKGEAIPLWARIFTVVDVWDALRSERVYHRAAPDDQVRAYLARQAGHQFDPHIVEAFMDILKSESDGIT